MSDGAWFFLVIGLWIAAQIWVLPRLGIST
jgi:hypothetical protein